MSGEDWLGDNLPDIRDPVKPEVKEATRKKELAFAQLYTVFKHDARAKELLAFWDRTLRRRRIAVNSSIQEYAAHAALRDFIEGIYQQIEFAENEGRL